MNIAVIGCSFSADHEGWPSMLGIKKTDNFSQKGISESKIYMNWKNLKNKSYDKVIVCHNSPNFIYTPYHPIHHNKKERSNTDWYMEDVNYHAKTNKEMQLVKNYLEKYNDDKYNNFIFEIILDKLLEIPNSIHITMQNYFTKKIQYNFNKIWALHQGNINHMDTEGNQKVAEKLKKVINL